MAPETVLTAPDPLPFHKEALSSWESHLEGHQTLSLWKGARRDVEICLDAGKRARDSSEGKFC